MGEGIVKRVVISAVNFTFGGPLSILLDCLKAIEKLEIHRQCEIIVLVHKKELVAGFDFCTVYEYPEIKSSWLKRIKFEFKESKILSQKLKPDLWIALHDITPNVTCPQVVYCHNPSPFYKIKLSKVFYDATFASFCLFYKYLYKINIQKNKFVIVQQQWLREAFEKYYKVKCVVAYPSNPAIYQPELFSIARTANKKFVFFYPAFARVAKNFEVLLEAATILSKKRHDFEVLATIDGTENKYAKALSEKYGSVESIRLIGAKKRDEVFSLYSDSDCLVFPSQLETWGLPITEYKHYEKPMLLADLRYAHETAGGYEFVNYFDSDNAEELARLMDLTIDGKLLYAPSPRIEPAYPFCQNWDELVKLLFTENNV